jgi:hypothetical protein
MYTIYTLIWGSPCNVHKKKTSEEAKPNWELLDMLKSGKYKFSVNLVKLSRKTLQNFHETENSINSKRIQQTIQNLWAILSKSLDISIFVGDFGKIFKYFKI